MSVNKMWGGRFREEVDRRVIDFTSSFSFDVRLLPYDIRGSIAHARMLCAAGLIEAGERDSLVRALGEIMAEHAATAPPAEEVEDVHSFVEARLRRKVGELAGKLHTARSRNDQVALDLRLYLVDVTGRTVEALRNLLETLVLRAEEHLGVIMPGFTHLQPAQPVLLSHHLLAYFEMFRRDMGRFVDARRRADQSPLGAGALAGTALPIDREQVARELGFAAVTRNSLDTVSERDFPVEFVAAAALTMAHLSRLAEEMVLWASPAYGFIHLPDRLATGSSMMPQKKNPDVAELVRGKSGRVYGHLMALLTVLKGLPLAYQRDLQEDKEAVFDSVDTLLACLDAANLFVGGVIFDAGRMAEESRREHTTATDLAEYLVTKGIPFRQAHQIVGGIVQDAQARGKNIDELGAEDLRRHSDLLGEDALIVLSPAGSVHRKASVGSTSPSRVSDALEEAKQFLAARGGIR